MNFNFGCDYYHKYRKIDGLFKICDSFHKK